MRSKREGGFTLIELLIVVAIIAILAAIAVPNFLEAQTRSKVSRTLADMRSVSVAIESYMVDTNNIPLPVPWRFNYSQAHFIAEWLVLYAPPGTSHSVPGPYPGTLLTTPIAYMTTIPVDMFNTKMLLRDRSYWGVDRKVNAASAVYSGFPLNRPTKVRDDFRRSMIPALIPENYHYALESAGPDLLWWQNTGQNAESWFYDPTNGTVSYGQILYFQGSLTYPRK